MITVRAVEVQTTVQAVEAQTIVRLEIMMETETQIAGGDNVLL